MSQLLDSHLFTKVLESQFSNFNSMAFYDGSGQCIFAKYEELSDIGSFSSILSSCQQYLPLAENEIALVNDPNSGGSLLSNMFFVKLLKIKTESKPAKFWFVAKTSFKPRLSIDENIESEGVRIPPMPIYANGELNKDILAAIENHPSAPVDFSKRITEFVQKLNRVDFAKLGAEQKSLFYKSNIRSYLNKCKERFIYCLRDFSKGEVTSARKLNDGSLLNLKLIVHEESIIFDFSGSSKPKSIYLTQSGTIGACVGAILYLIDLPALYVNQAILDSLQIIAPQGTLVNAKDAKALSLSLSDGTSFLANTIVAAIGNLDRAKAQTAISSSQCNVEVDFGNKKQFFDFSPMGGAASPMKPGQDAYHPWNLKKLHTSIEEIERRYPLYIEEVNIRKGSGGDGNKMGGNGISKKIQVLEDAKFCWAVVDEQLNPKGILGGKDALPAEIILQKEDGTTINLQKIGSRDLKAGSSIIIHSAGAGGYGDTPTDDE